MTEYQLYRKKFLIFLKIFRTNLLFVLGTFVFLLRSFNLVNMYYILHKI